MDFLNRAKSFVYERLHGKVEQQQEQLEKMSLFDAYLNFFYKTITWEDPKLSWMTFIFLNMLYVLIVYWEVRFYCFLCMSFIVWVTLDYYGGDFIDVKQCVPAVSCKKINNGIKSTVMYLKSLKRENPSVFCSVMVAMFTSLSFIGRSIPGHILSYLILLGVYFGPYAVGLIPEEKKQFFKQMIANFQTTEGIVAETELIPFISPNFNEERDPDLDSLLTDRTQDSVTNSLISGLSTMPSYLDADCNPDDIEEDDLLPQPSSKRLYSAVDYSSDSDSDRNIEFDSAHFNRDSSSDDDAKFTEDLKFTDEIDKPSTAQSIGAGLYSNLTAMGSSLITNVLQTAASQLNKSSAGTPRRDSDSDFEIINSEDTEDT